VRFANSLLCSLLILDLLILIAAFFWKSGGNLLIGSVLGSLTVLIWGAVALFGAR
jgi:hypothetical protein